MANKYLAQVAGRIKEIAALVTSAGASDAGKLVALDTAGKIDSSLIPSGLTSLTSLMQAMYHAIYALDIGRHIAEDHMSAADQQTVVQTLELVADLAAHSARAIGGGVLTRRPAGAPSSSASPGVPGQYTYDGSYFYLCTAMNTWARFALTW